MKQLHASCHKDAQLAEEKRKLLELRGWTVEIFGPADRMTVDTIELDGGNIATGEKSWVVIGTKD